MTGPNDPAGRLGFLGSALAVGVAWGALLFSTLAFRLPPGPETAAQWVVLASLCVLLALVHGAATSLVGATSARLDGGAGFAGTIVAALALALLYSALAVSLVKFVAVRAHLRLSDFAFLARSWRQVAGEATPTERRALLLATLLPLVLAFAAYAFLRRTRPSARAFERRAGVALLVVALAGLGLFAVLRPDARWALRTLIPETALAARFVDEAGLARRGEARPDPTRQARIEPYRTASAPERWNVVVLVLESVPWKRLLGPDARPATTPRLLELARSSVVFDRAYASSVHSDYAQTSILASLYPEKFEQHDFFVDLDYPRLLPWDLLGPLGWRSAVFSTQNERWGNMRAFLETRSLQLFRHAPDFPGARRRGSGVETKIFEQEVVPAFLDWAARDQERPFVAYLNFQATHFPYVVPASDEAPSGGAALPAGISFLAYPKELEPLLLDRFHAALAYEDLWLGHLVDGLRAQGVWERTALLVVADHGEAFHEHGAVTHGTSLFEEQVRVPMLLRLPGSAGATLSRPVSTLDALPSLYRAMGLARHGALQGHDDTLAATADAEERIVPFCLQGMSNARGLVAGDLKWIVDSDRSSRALFDLASDPGETRNLLEARQTDARRLESELGRFLDLQLGYYVARGWTDGWYAPRLP